MQQQLTRIGFVDERQSAFAEESGVRLAGELGLPLVGSDSPGFDAFLVLTARRLELRVVEARGPGPIYVDFVARRWAPRGVPGTGSELLVRAVGARQGRRPSVVDATTGLGQDAAMLARFGCPVTAIERSAVVAALLRDGLRRAMQDEPARRALDDRLTIVQADARQWLEAVPAEARPDVVYLDPMYTERGLSLSAAKKEMQVLRRLVGTDEDASALFAVAMRVARERVVVKRHQHAAPLAGNPSITFTGRSTRFDVYLRLDADRIVGHERG